MDVGAMLGESFDYTKDAVWEKWGRWIVLVVVSLINGITFNIIPIFNGYLVRIWSGEDPAPEPEEWGRMFIDGWKVNIIGIVYFLIPLGILLLIFGLLAVPVVLFQSLVEGHMETAIPGALAAAVAIPIIIIVLLLISLIAILGTVRFAHTGRLGEAFNFRAIVEHIGAIGWGSYIFSLIILWVVLIVFTIIIALITAIPILGLLLNFFLVPLLSIFSARYVTLIYESEMAPS